MRRWAFFALLVGIGAAWPLGAQAQQALPVIGFLGSTSPEQYAIRLTAFDQGLKDAGYTVGQNVAIEYRWAEGQYDRLPALAADLVRRQVVVIAAAGGTPSALAAKAATSTIPIAFGTATDPVEAGLVASLNRPGGNITGVTNQNAQTGPKRLELVRELLPKAARVAVIVNPASPTMVEQFRRSMEPAARSLGIEIHILQASTRSDLDAAFATSRQMRADALIIDPDIFFNSQTEDLAVRALRDAIPAIYQYRRFAEAGGLMSYGASDAEYYRLFGAQVGKILRGAKPAELPVEQATKIELIINLKTAKALGLTIPQSILARADEVIE